MTRLLWTLLLAAPAVADPHVRWIDPKGTVHVTELREVVQETGRNVTMRTLKGRTLELKLLRVLRLVREDETDPEQRDLLRARTDVESGRRLEEARPVLDRLVRDGSPAWVSEYAAAYRAVLAERAGEKDALKRIDAFLKEHESSRFFSMVRLARARILARAAEKLGIIDVYEAAYEDIVNAGGPLRARFQTFIDATRSVCEADESRFPEYWSQAATFLDNEVAQKDVFHVLVKESTQLWMEIVYHRGRARRVVAAGHRPVAARSELARVRNQSELFLPELRSDAHRELGIVMLACGDRADAKAEFEKAVEIAPDQGRKEAATEALEKLKTAKKRQ